MVARLVPFVLASLLALACGYRTAQPTPLGTPVVSGPTASPALVAELTALDRRLFELVFDHRDDTALRALLADDFQFHHDKSGLDTFTSPEAFVAAIRLNFERRATGENLRARREPLAGSEAIYALAQHGAIHTGEHRFYGLEAGKPDQLRETGRFFHVWRKVEGRWRLAQVYSYDHRAATPRG
ncbi:MAG TPA: nuclear transport factor 2 family protein [Holophagaceae bacterium]|nr:nuclear transport factor 2 family protein [Holophagaceae bacterium]